MAHKTLPDVSKIRQILKFYPETGQLVWREIDATVYSQTEARSPESLALNHNSRRAGKPAGHLDTDGYLKIGVFGKRHGAHRLAWVIHYGCWPNGVIDHINGIPIDNRIENLRDVTQRENSRNRSRVSKKSASGEIGVYVEKNGKFRAQGMSDGKFIYLGVHSTMEAALAARKAFEVEHGLIIRR